MSVPCVILPDRVHGDPPLSVVFRGVLQPHSIVLLHFATFGMILALLFGF
jgi:hypothetical protein